MLYVHSFPTLSNPETNHSSHFLFLLFFLSVEAVSSIRDELIGGVSSLHNAEEKLGRPCLAKEEEDLKVQFLHLVEVSGEYCYSQMVWSSGLGVDY